MVDEETLPRPIPPAPVQMPAPSGVPHLTPSGVIADYSRRSAWKRVAASVIADQAMVNKSS